MPKQQLKLHMGELTPEEERVAREAIAWANAAAEDAIMSYGNVPFIVLMNMREKLFSKAVREDA